MMAIDPECEAVSRLFSKKSVRLQVPAQVKSENPVFRRKGSSFNLKSLREYQPFDDLRQIDWKLYGRTDRYYIKEFYEEENERFFLLVDTSASLPVFGGDYYRTFIASLAYIFLKLHFTINLIAFSDRLESSCLNIKEERGVPRAFAFLRRLAFSGGTDLPSVLRAVRDRHRPSTLFLFSDLFDRRLTLRHLEPFRRVFLVHFHTPFAALAVKQPELEVRDPESGERLMLPYDPLSRRSILDSEREFLGRFAGARAGHHYLRLESTMERVPFYWRILEALYD
jgi:uncharacterized protein (DUF58 family)